MAWLLFCQCVFSGFPHFHGPPSDWMYNRGEGTMAVPGYVSTNLEQVTRDSLCRLAKKTFTSIPRHFSQMALVPAIGVSLGMFNPAGALVLG